MSTSSVSGASTYSSSGGSSSKVTGLVSGLDTTSIINAIMTQAALPQTNLKSQLVVEQAKLTAYQTINTQMQAAQTAADALADPMAWQAMAVTSSSSSVSATASPSAQAGTLTFDVAQLATGQTSVSAQTFSSTSAPVVTSGTPVTLSVNGGSTVTIDTGDGSLSAVAAGINAAKAGVQASIVQTGTSAYRLQLSSTTTGASAGFTVSGISGGLNAMTSAQDAQIAVGGIGNANGYTIDSSSNTFTNAIPGLTFTISQVASGVTLTTSADTSGISDKVQAMVDAANKVLTTISTVTAYDTSTSTASVLTGDSSVNQLRDSILSSVATMVGGGQSAGSVGLSVTKDGQLSFDSSVFQAALAANPASVQSIFGPSGSFSAAKTGLSGTVTLQKSSDASQVGTYDVTVTQAATKASATIDTTNGGSGLVANQTITLGSGSNSATYTVQSGDTVDSVVNALNALAAQNSLSVTATADASNPSLIDLSSTGYGSEYTFTSAATGGLAASSVTAGQDVVGTINGQTAKGIGQLLYTLPGTPGVGAMTLNVTLTPADVAALGGASAGSFTYNSGAAQNLASVAYGAVNTLTGSLTNQINGANTMIGDLNTQIANWQVVLDTKQTALEQQWANLESQLSNLQAQGSQLSAAITSMSGGASSSSSSKSSSGG